MSDWAKVGVQCVCINDDFGCMTFGEYCIPTRIPMIGEILTISRIDIGWDGICLGFEEIPISQADGPLRAEFILYSVRCFRPLLKRKTDISIFQNMLLPAPGPTVPA